MKSQQPITRNEIILHLGFALSFLAAGLWVGMRPELDLALSAEYFVPGQGFIYAGTPGLTFLFDAVDVIGRALFVVLLLLWPTFLYLGRHSSGARKWTAPIAFVLLALMLGPGLLTHQGFKDNWGRARPRNVVEFGGQAQFTPALQPSDQCKRNCSFVSGHAAMSYFPIVIAFVRRRQRRIWLTVGALTGLLIGWTRVMVGAHFVSDILLAYLTTYLPALGLALIWHQLPLRLSQKRAKVLQPGATNPSK